MGDSSGEGEENGGKCNYGRARPTAITLVLAMERRGYIFKMLGDFKDGTTSVQLN